MQADGMGSRSASSYCLDWLIPCSASLSSPPVAEAKLKNRIEALDHRSELPFARHLQKRIQGMDRRGLR